jgi:acyl-CoA thioesterase-1
VRRPRRRAYAFVLALGLAACRAGSAPSRDIPSAAAPVIVFFGDSITRGMGLDESEAYPAVIQKKLAAAGLDYRCVNGGVSGDTTSDALARVTTYRDMHPRVVLVELGANDAWKGLNRVQTRENLLKILRAFSDDGARVILAGTEFPHLQHPAYVLALEREFETIAKETGAELIPDLMTGVASVRELNQEDGLHPTAEGQRRLAETAWPAIERAARGSR